MTRACERPAIARQSSPERALAFAYPEHGTRTHGQTNKQTWYTGQCPGDRQAGDPGQVEDAAREYMVGVKGHKPLTGVQ